jgi:carbamate kinase
MRRPAPLVIAFGGNALIRPGEVGTVEEQAARVAEVAEQVVQIQAPGGLVLTHGNGPQVGRHLLRSDLLKDQIPPTPLDVAVAATEGEIGWLFQVALNNSLARRGDPRRVVTLITQVVVCADDPAFHEPTKYVGRFYTEAEARERARELGWQVKRDSDRGWRRVVASPVPLEIVEAPLIDLLARAGVIVIACGGGGVPVIRSIAGLAGVEAVIDKDLTSALLAASIGAETLMVLTGVDQVWLDYERPTRRPLATVSLAELRGWAAEGQFPPGSMGPKIDAAIGFLTAPRPSVDADPASVNARSVVVTSPENLARAMAGGPCTRILA